MPMKVQSTSVQVREFQILQHAVYCYNQLFTETDDPFSINAMEKKYRKQIQETHPGTSDYRDLLGEIRIFSLWVMVTVKPKRVVEYFVGEFGAIDFSDDLKAFLSISKCHKKLLKLRSSKDYHKLASRLFDIVQLCNDYKGVFVQISSIMKEEFLVTNLKNSER